MKLEISIGDDKELRNFIKDQIRNEIKSILRDDVREIVKEILEGTNGRIMEECQKTYKSGMAIITNRVDYLTRNNEELIKLISRAFRPIIKDVDINRIIAEETRKMIREVKQ